jgi:hypothetical protein
VRRLIAVRLLVGAIYAIETLRLMLRVGSAHGFSAGGRRIVFVATILLQSPATAELRVPPRGSKRVRRA